MTDPNRWEAILEQSALGFLAGQLAESSPPDAVGETAGTVVGRYRLLEEIGRGGMGTVWLAERADGHFEQRVALKLVKRGMDTDEIIARFLRERQILARLEHPHIARLLDGGVSGDGRPYFVMEYVAGEPITNYCDGQRLSVEGRLRLFVETCRAVQHAHRSLVVHRDLKPSNVLVTQSGEVKLLDFGVAKLLEDEAESAVTGATVKGPMTPEYASPEQLAGEPVTTASDVYQLGLLLYELLSGHRPWGRKRRSADEPDPLRPSTAARQVVQIAHTDGTTQTIEPLGVSERRRTTPERLSKRLRGDLDSIALGALRREPGRRYASAEALAEDVERHLAELPLRVRDAGWAYQAGKFIRRYRWRLATVALLLAGVVGGLAFYTMRIRHERDVAVLEAAKAAQGAEILGQVFGGWSPDAANRGEVSAALILGNARRRAEAELRNQPELLAASLSTLGELYAKLGESAVADSLFQRALQLQEPRASVSTADLAATLARRGKLLSGFGNPAQGTGLLRRALRLHQVLFGDDRIETLRVQRDLGINLRALGRVEEAESLLRATLGSVGAAEREGSPFALETAADLGYVLFLQARYDEAIALLRTTLQHQQKTFGEQYAPAMVTARYLGSSLRDRGKLDEAEALYRHTLRISRDLYGEQHEQTGYAINVLSILLERKGELAEAERLARQAVAILRTGPIAAVETVRLGGIRLDRGDPVEAEQLLRRGLAALRRAQPSGSLDEADALNRLAFLLLARRAPDAARWYAEAAAFDRARPAGAPVFVSDGLHFLARAHQRQGDLPAAEAAYRRALALYQIQLPANHPYTLAAQRGLAEVSPR